MRRVLAIPILLLALWALLSWWGERGQRQRLLEQLTQPTAREGFQEKEIQALQADKLRLEKELLSSELAKQRAIENLGHAVNRLQEKVLAKAGLEEMDEAQRKQELDNFRDNLQLVRRINRGLRMNGGGWIRILSLDDIDGEILSEVMISVVGTDGLYEGAYLASTCCIHMDRESGKVRLVLGKGMRFLRKKKIPFDDGLELAFESHWPRLFAKDLHELIAFEGEWPKPIEKPKWGGDLKIVMLWRSRLDVFFEALSVKGQRLELQELHGVGNGNFEGVSLFGYSKKGLLEQRMKARKMEFWIDKDRDRVELRLVDGYIEDKVGRVEFPKKTWRMVLQGMGAKQAGSLLAGFVTYSSPSPERK